jgi:hypothetical protein
MVMMMVVAMMMVGRRISWYYSTGQNNEGNDSKEQRTQLHDRTPSQLATLSNGVTKRQRNPFSPARHTKFSSIEAMFQP